MQLAALGLGVLLIPVQVQPFQPVKDGIERGLRVAVHVRVVDAQNHSAAIPARIQPVKDERPGASNVQIARRRRGKTDTRHETSGYLFIQSRELWYRKLLRPAS